jgi:magnesium transporter
VTFAPDEPLSGQAKKHAQFWRRRRRRPPPGSPPGTLVVPEEPVCPVVRRIVYDAERIEEHAVPAGDEPAVTPVDGQVLWIDVQGLGDLALVRHLGERFGLHPLVLADLVHVNQRAKVEAYENHLFIVLRMVHQDEALWTEQLSVVLGKDFVLTFQERPGDCFDPVRARLRRAQGRLRSRGADYLAYPLLDALIDSYFPVLEHQGELLEEMERDVVEAPEASHISRIRALKRDLLELRRALWPLRDAMAHLLHDEIPLIGTETRLFLRDCADHVFQLMDMVEIDREVASGLIDLHLSSLSMRMNEIMKVLTIIATIFIPLGFIAGLYGMNFDPAVSPFNMPELHWYFGYPMALALMLAVAGGLLAYFRRKGWLGGRGDD